MDMFASIVVGDDGCYGFSMHGSEEEAVSSVKRAVVERDDVAAAMVCAIVHAVFPSRRREDGDDV